MISSCMDARASRHSRQIALTSHLATEWTDNQADIYTLDHHDLTVVWLGLQVANGQTDEEIVARFEALTETYSLTLSEKGFELVSLYGATALNAGRDGHVLTVLTRDMQRSGNVLGHFAIRPHNGRNYIVFKGNHRLRQVIRGTRYSLSNPTVIKLGIGTEGLKGAAKGGIYVTLVVSVGVNSYAWIFDESFGWQNFLSNLSADLVKAAIAVALGLFVAKKTAIVTGSIVIANGLGFVVGIFLGVGMARLRWSDISDFATQVANAYVTALDSITNPAQLFSAQRQRIGDFTYCAVDAAGTAVIEAMQQEVERRVYRLLRRLSPLNIR